MNRVRSYKHRCSHRCVSCRKYGGHCWRNVGLYEYRLGMVHRALGESPELATDHLRTGLNILKVTHGTGHQLVQKISRTLESTGSDL